MRALGAALVATFAATFAASLAAAQPAPIGGPAVRKPLTDKYNTEALSKFVDGIIADKAGDYGEALRRYEQSNKAAEHANTYYNIADIQRRIDEGKRAVAAYRKYLELEPAAKDRAAVEKLIGELETGSVMVVIDGDEPDAIVLVDGKLVGPSPVTTRLPQGPHVADRITPTGMDHRSFTLRFGDPEHLKLDPPRRSEAGNVILSTGPGYTTSGRFKDAGGREWNMPGRNEAAPGRYESDLFRGSACNKVAFDVAPGDHLTYVYVDGGPRTPEGCVPVTVKVQRLPKVVAK